MKSTEIDKKEDILSGILKTSGPPRLFTTTVTSFRDIYAQIVSQHGPTSIDVVLNDGWAMVQFTEYGNSRIRVLSDAKLRRLTFGRRHIDKSDFEIARTSANFYGQTDYLSMRKFIGEELRTNGLTAAAIFFATMLFLRQATSLATEPEVIVSSTCDIVLQVAAIFISVFLLFTASQNLSIMSEAAFKHGLAHRWIRVDRYIAYAAVLTIGLAALGRVGATIGRPSLVTLIDVYGFQISLLQGLVLISSAAITMIAIALIIVVQYYFRRFQRVYETEYTKQILDKVMDETTTIAGNDGC